MEPPAGSGAGVSLRCQVPEPNWGHENKEVQEIQVGFWARRRAGDTCADRQVTLLSKACPSMGELGGTPQEGLGLGDKAGGMAIVGTHWPQGCRQGGGVALVLGPAGEPFRLLVLS